MIVGGVEDLLVLVVHILCIPLVAIHQRTGSKEQHAGSHGECHDAIDTTIFRRIVIDRRQSHRSLVHLFVTIVNHIVKLGLSYHELREFKVCRCDIVGLERYAAIVLCHLPPGVCAEELHLVFHVVDFRLWQVVVGHSLHHVVEDIAMTDVSGHHVPQVTTPCGVDGPLS